MNYQEKTYVQNCNPQFIQLLERLDSKGFES